MVMIVAIFRVHWQHGYFMDWYGNQGGEGFALIVGGAGAWSLDALVAQWGNAS
jgi:putative oxidoreductase